LFAQQYEITLPADYDMAVIRKRVAVGGASLDERAGLGLKAYLIRERGVEGSPVNQYAPFYLWNGAGPMAAFFVGDGGFFNIVRDFGRQPVRQWFGVACHTGPDRGAAPAAASRLVRTIPAAADATPERDGRGLATWVGRAVEELARTAARPGVHTAALAVDPTSWELVRFILWRESVPADEETTECYEVLHLAEPEINALSEGRAWQEGR
jgi:hypothetical protein